MPLTPALSQRERESDVSSAADEGDDFHTIAVR
jgi:hypothetical protein